MQKLISCLFLLASVACLSAQTPIQRSIEPGNAQQLDFVSLYADVRFESWSGSTIEISGSVSINDGLNDEIYQLETYVRDAKVVIEDKMPGLDKLPNTFLIEYQGKRIRIPVENNKDAQKVVDQKYPDGKAKIISYGNEVDIELLVKVPGNISLDVKMTYGSIYLDKYPATQHVDVTYGAVEAQLVNNGPLPEIHLKSTYGPVDVAVSPTTSVEVDMESDYGSLYSDLPLKIDTERSKTKAFSQHIIARLNGGDSARRLQLRAPYGNIYLRSL